MESIELIHQLMGNMFQLTINTDGGGSDCDATGRLSQSQNDDTFTPQNRTNHLFSLMDEDSDGKADFNDFKRIILNDASIIQGFLVYDGVI